jgi:hypothetical protein
MILFVDADDPVGVHEAVRHHGEDRRRDRDPVEIQASGPFLR